MLYAVYCLMLRSEFSIMRQNLSFRISLKALFLILSSFSVLFQAICSLDFDFEESIIILEQLYQNRNNVVSHLKLADRVNAFIYHMKEVNFLIHCIDSRICALFPSTFIFLSAEKPRRDILQG